MDPLGRGYASTERAAFCRAHSALIALVALYTVAYFGFYWLRAP